MTASKNNKKAVVIVKAPKIVTAWNNVCKVSNKSEQEVFASIVNLHEVLTNESRLSVADKKKFIKGLEEGGAVSSFIKASHVPAIPTLMNFRKIYKDFATLPIAKQLSTAMASYDILGVGKGETFKSLEILTKEISAVRKAKAEKAKEGATTPTKPAKAKATIADTLRAAISLVNSIGDDAEDEVYDLILELAQAANIKVGISA